MLSSTDLAAYFQRIGFAGTPAADRATLAAIVQLHAQTIAFENLDPLLGRPVALTPAALVDKLVHHQRGGYCFEQNGLLELVLQSLGFAVTGLAARVLWMQPADAETPRSHKLLRVDLPEGPVIVDVGFGGNTLTGVLDLVPDAVQQTPHEPFRLVVQDEEWRQQVRIGGEWRTTYRFHLHPQLPVDYEVSNWWTATSPASQFTANLVAALPLPGRRLTLRNADYAIHRLDAPSEQRRLSGPDEICDLLQGEFGLDLPDRAAVEQRLAPLFADA